MNMQVWMGILLPFLGTGLGAAMVFVLKDQISDGVQRLLTGFAAGVMVAASFWSLLDPALESAEGMGRLSFVPAAGGRNAEGKNILVRRAVRRSGACRVADHHSGSRCCDISSALYAGFCGRRHV